MRNRPVGLRTLPWDGAIPFPLPLTNSSAIFINPIPFGDNMADSIIDKIRKAAEARDNAIKEQAKKGMCAPCGEPLTDCMCNYDGPTTYIAVAGEE